MGGFGNVYNPKKKVGNTAPKRPTSSSNWSDITSGAVTRSHEAAKAGKPIGQMPRWNEIKSSMDKYGMGLGAAKSYVYDYGGDTGGAVNPTPAPQLPGGPGGGSGGRGGGWGGGGGGGGGGGINPALAAQAQMDYLAGLLGGQNWQAQPMTGLRNALQTQRDALGALRTNVANATAQDQAAATGAYNNLDTWLTQNQRNPYADVKLVAAQAAPDMNPYLASQGAPGTNYQATNPEDGGMGAFQNVLALLGANQQAGNQSRLAESQMGRTFAGQQIGAIDNAYLANIGQQDVALAGQEGQIAAQEQQQQMALEAEKRKALLELAALIGQGAKAPDLAALGLA